MVDPDALDSDPFIRQVTVDAERMAQREKPEAPVQTSVHPTPGPPYSVGDTVYLENDRPFVIGISGNFNVRLQDLALAIPSRAESIESFERLLRRNPKNRAFTDFLAARLRVCSRIFWMSFQTACYRRSKGHGVGHADRRREQL